MVKTTSCRIKIWVIFDRATDETLYEVYDDELAASLAAEIPNSGLYSVWARTDS